MNMVSNTWADETAVRTVGADGAILDFDVDGEMVTLSFLDTSSGDVYSTTYDVSEESKIEADVERLCDKYNMVSAFII